MSYLRVIPRDLFNEAKLLKCLGQLSLLIHDGVRIPRGLTLEHDTFENEGFVIEQNESTGALYCANLECLCGQRLIGLQSPLNAKDAYPLQFSTEDELGRVFNEDGSLSDEFRTLCATLTPKSP